MTETTLARSETQEEEVVYLRPSKGWTALKLGDLWRYRELVFFMIWRDIKVRYKQTALGAAWAVLQPFMTMVVFTIFFGRLAKIPSDNIPYPIFSYTGLLPWGLFTKALSDAGRSMISNRSMITKVYFPRLVIPLASVLSGLVDFAIAFVVLMGMMVYYNVVPVKVQATNAPIPIVATAPSLPAQATAQAVSLSADATASAAQSQAQSARATATAANNLALGLQAPVAGQAFRLVPTSAIWTLPLFLLLALITALGVGLWLSALNVLYRDINYILPFLIQFWLFITPIAYPSSMIPAKWRLLYALNPMTGVVEGFRWALLGTGTAPGPMLTVSTAIALIVLVSGLFYFRRMERTFADQI